MTYYDVNPDVVATAGNNTAATSGGWQAWGGQADTALRTAATEVQESTVTSAVESYLSIWNPKFQSVAQQVEALGTNTTSASNTVANADADSTTLLDGQGSIFESNGSVLSRPLTAGGGGGGGGGGSW